jgi:ketosteroid isomerase-like protein
MNLSMRSKFFSFAALLAVAGASVEEVDLEKAVGALIAAEKAYAKLAGEKGFREASISAFADDAVIFRPNPGQREKVLAGSEGGSCDGLATDLRVDLAERRGWLYDRAMESSKSRDAQKPDAFRHFVTIWQKNGNGMWKVCLGRWVGPSPATRTAD